MTRAWLMLGASLGGGAFGCTSEPAHPSIATGGAAMAGAVGVAGQAGSTNATSGASSGGSAGNEGVGGAALPDAATDAASTNPIDAGPDATDSGAPTLPKRVLLYHFSTLDIPSVPAQLSFFKAQLATWKYDSDDSVDPTQLDDQNLQRYAAVAMINTCFEPFGPGKPDRPQSEVLQRFLHRGGGLFGTHCASVTFQSANPPVLYNQLIGGRGGNGFFDGTSQCRSVAGLPSTGSPTAPFSFSGNLDNTDFLASSTVVLVKCQWQTANGKDVNVSWYRNEGAGRVFYTDFAKVDADLTNPNTGPHITTGLAWVLGLN